MQQISKGEIGSFEILNKVEGIEKERFWGGEVQGFTSMAKTSAVDQVSSSKDLESTMTSLTDVRATSMDTSPESPIKNQGILRVLENRGFEQGFEVLEFRQKKVIRAEDKRLINLLALKKYKSSLLSSPTEPLIKTAHRQESSFIRKIKKSGITRRVHKFWNQRTNFYPIVFKKLSHNDEDHQVVVEFYDLSKEKFSGEETPGNHNGQFMSHALSQDD